MSVQTLARAATLVAIALCGLPASTATAQEINLEDLKRANQTQRQVQWNLTIVWDRLDTFLRANHDIIIDRLDRRDFTAAITRPRVNLTGWVTCTQTNLDEVPVNLRMDITLRRAGQGGTWVYLLPYFTSTESGAPLPDCKPTGGFENRIFMAL